MMNQRGQISILIAIIFQVLFIFFAMVVNVGLLVHDKVNLQNSTDIAAYYGAMKQAEVLNAIAQVNYQIRQIWKLFNFRLWVLADAGRNEDFQDTLGSETADIDIPANFTDGFQGPTVCVANLHWVEYLKTDPILHKPLNLCKAHNGQMIYQALRPLPLSPIQKAAGSLIAGGLDVFVETSKTLAEMYESNFKTSGNDNFAMAIRLLASYKWAISQRRQAIRRLESLIVGQNGSNINSGDFTDLSGTSVGAIAKITFEKNLTAANRRGETGFNFLNGASGHPFLVPSEVRTFITYSDPFPGQVTKIKHIVEMPNKIDAAMSKFFEASKMLFAVDYYGSVQAPESAMDFLNESDDAKINPNTFNSLVGFEKNPWVMAYIHVQASTRPSMLFVPFAKSLGINVELKAESYAMPFGGHIGPWFYKTWPQNSASSLGSGVTDQIDPLLPPRMDSSQQGKLNYEAVPNFSRYPGDPVGMKSRKARYIGVASEGSDIPTIAEYQKLIENPTGSDFDPVVQLGSTRNLEMAAISPDIFDSVYYSINYDWAKRLGNSATVLFKQWCNGHCYNLGSNVSGGINSEVRDLLNQTATVGLMSHGTWFLKKEEHVNLSWSQGGPGQYSSDLANGLAGASWPDGGRSGYSVKLVSKRFLTSPLNLGNSGEASIVNMPE